MTLPSESKSKVFEFKNCDIKTFPPASVTVIFAKSFEMGGVLTGIFKSVKEAPNPVETLDLSLPWDKF